MAGVTLPSRAVVWIRDFLSGLCIGIANIIPGVSGGTFLLILGMYERVIGILHRVNASIAVRFITAGFSLLRHPGSRRHRMRFGLILRKLDAAFMIRLGIGTLMAIVLLSELMAWLLTRQFESTYGFFFGLILVSVIIPWRLLLRPRPVHLLLCVAGLAATVAVASTGNPYEKERAKTRLYTEMAQEGDAMQSSALFGATGYSAYEYLWILCAGAVAISAMVLPGISGSLVLIVFGVYFEVITAISHLKSLQISALLYLSVFSVGMVAGLFLFARLVNWLLSRFHDATMAFLIGLMAGSLYALWPFKEYRIMDKVEKGEDGIRIIEDAVVYTNTNILPSAWEQVWGVLISAAFGAGIMMLFIHFGGKKEGASDASVA